MTFEQVKAKSEPDARTGCWNWTGSRFPNGYGQCWHGGGGKGAHRVSWELVNGPIPEGLVVRHKCDNRQCVNPDHLEVGTHKENTADMLLRGRRPKVRGMYKETCLRGHPRTGYSARTDHRGFTVCRACATIRAREYRRRRA